MLTVIGILVYICSVVAAYIIGVDRNQTAAKLEITQLVASYEAKLAALGKKL